MKLYKIRKFAQLKGLSTAAIYKKIKLGMKYELDEKGERVISEEHYQEYLKSIKKGRPKKGENND